ncbi:zeta toxin family protein [Gordonia sp. X0973]|uniref:zeta toxin family protein n=1 Tax=Gordonia sp. X0973 TaxID=2742602 RepID=UPI000F52CBFB|nr:zeta toxin family protein [Gordonia sp. X0973]QKT06752.1 zeta toxin family protein [Gordonia sp. X0973]
MTAPRLDLVAGCNGAGKSSLIHAFLLPRLPASAYVNADDIATRQWPDSAEEMSYEAASIAAKTRNSLIDSGRSLIAETVFSHPSKLELVDRAHLRGFRVVMHVVMVPENEAVARVQTRVESGGHNVPEEKIRDRYQRVWPLAATAIRRADTARVYDNSGRSMRVVAKFTAGIATTAQWPGWTPETLLSLTDVDRH